MGDRVGVGGVDVEAVPALHDGRRYPVGRPRALGFLPAPPRVYFAGDTDLFDGMAALAGRVDLAALPIGAGGRACRPGTWTPNARRRPRR